MSTYTANIAWQRSDEDVFIDNKYSRAHRWQFDGGVEVPASSSPHVVPLPYSVEANVDPEEAFVAALSSCHMLFFLSIAAKKKFLINRYDDHAYGTMEKNAKGKLVMTHVFLRPRVEFSGELRPSKEMIDHIHHLAHEECFLAKSVMTDVIIQAQHEPDASIC